MKKKLLIFDLDGTLVNSVPDLTIAVNQMLASYTKKSYTEEEVTPWVGNGVELLVERALSGSSEVDPNLNPETVKEATELYLDKYEALQNENTILYPKVIETLEELSSQGFKMSLITNKPHRFVEELLDRMNLNKYFVEAIGAGFLEKKKPDPMPLLWMVEKTGFKVKDAVMIGDSTNDIKAAHNANMDSIGLSYGYNYNTPIQDANPTKTIDNFNELLDFLQIDE